MPLASPHGYTIEEARARFVAGIAPVGTEDLPLEASLGRILASPLLAQRLVPDSPRAAVDGWAVRSDDLVGASPESQVRLRVAGSSLAGHPAAGSLEPGETLRITTGGVVPEGADAAEYQEVCRQEGDYVLFARPVAHMANVRPAGEDMRPGQELLAAGERVRPEVLGLLATLAQERVQVRRRPRVRFVSTGDEIYRVGAPLPSGGTIDSNSLQIGGLLRELGMDVEFRGPVPDSAAAIAEACQGDSFDFLVTSGGVSVGPADRIGEVGRMLGAKVMFHWARMRPGAPTMGLRLGERPWLGLSGNPLSAQVGFDLFGRAALGRLIGAELGFVRGQARIVAEFRGRAPDAPRLLRATVQLVGAELHASVHSYQSSGGVRAMAQTNAYVIQPKGVAKLEAGSLVDALVLPI